MTIEKRIFVSPIEPPPITLANGKLGTLPGAPLAVHVHVVRAIYDGDTLVVSLPAHRTAIYFQIDGTWMWNKEPNPEIAAALDKATNTIREETNSLVERFGVADHEIVQDGKISKVEYLKSVTGKFVRTITTV